MDALELLQQFRDEMLPAVKSNCECANCRRDRTWIIKINLVFDRYERPQENQPTPVAENRETVCVPGMDQKKQPQADRDRNTVAGTAS